MTAYSLSTPAPSLILFGDKKKNENEFSQKQSKPIHTLTAKVVLCTPETRADARINPEVRENRRQTCCFQAAFAGLNMDEAQELWHFF